MGPFPSITPRQAGRVCRGVSSPLLDGGTLFAQSTAATSICVSLMPFLRNFSTDRVTGGLGSGSLPW